MVETREHKGWYRPRSLPHFDTPERPQFLTFRLADSLPAAATASRVGEGAADYRRRIEAALDAGAGACWLAQPDIARIVVGALLHGSGRSHEIHAFVVMPNHVHVLAVFDEGFRLPDVVRSWKGYSARRINEILERYGALWQKDYFDRYCRNETEFENVRAYIENNPVVAGLAKRAEDWPFSSARSLGLPADEG